MDECIGMLSNEYRIDLLITTFPTRYINSIKNIYSMKSKKKIYLLIPYLLLISLFSKADTIYVESNIEAVNVYYQGAEVNRNASLSIPKGQHVLIFDDLPYEISEDEYQLKASHSDVIVSLKLDKKRGKLKGKSEVAKSLELEIEALIDESKDIEQRAFILDTKKKVLLSNSQVHADTEGIDIAELEKAIQYFDNKLNTIRQERLKLKARLKAIEEEIKERNKRIQNSIRVTNKNYSQIIVHVSNNELRDLDLRLSYFLKSAGWRPTYNLKVEQIDKPLSLEFQAELFQSTSENWSNVRLKLSDAKPTKSTDFPEFKPWYLEEPQRYKKQDVFYTTLEGVVGNVSTGDVLPFSEIEILKADKTYKRIVTDEYGVFKVNPIPTGQYSLIIKNRGFHTITQHIQLSKLETKFLEIGLKDANVALVTISDIEAKPVRGVAGLVAQAAGIAQADAGASLSVHGGRSEQTVYFVDGVKVLGTPNIANVAMDNYNILNRGIGNYRSQKEYKDQIHIKNQVNEHQLNTQYELQSPHDILSNGEEYTLRIKTIEMPTEYEYVVFAKEDPSAFLKGKVANMNAYNLFSGKANIYFKGEYVGQTLLDSRHLSDTTALFLGKDNDIIVERTQRIVTNKNTFMTNGKSKSDLDVLVTIKNNKKQPINLVVVEQYPKTKQKEILITLIDAEGAKNHEKTGKLEWKSRLNPNEKQEFKYQYLTKYPSYINVD